MNDVADFSLQLGKVAKILDLRLEAVIKKVAFDLHADITFKTPVDTGRARASWNLSVGSPSPETPAPVAKKGETVPLTVIDPSALDGANLRTEPIYITSNLDYVQYLEGGSSKQAPEGMVRLSVMATVAELEIIVAQAVAEHPL